MKYVALGIKRHSLFKGVFVYVYPKKSYSKEMRQMLLCNGNIAILSALKGLYTVYEAV